jgi:hypothetical protein
MESSDVNLKKAQADKIYVETGVLAPAEVRKNRLMIWKSLEM